MVTRFGPRATATYAGRDYRIAVPLSSPVQEPAALPVSTRGRGLVDTLRWLGSLWLEGWTRHVSAVRERRPGEL